MLVILKTYNGLLVVKIMNMIVCSALEWEYNFAPEESLLVKLKAAINNIRGMEEVETMLYVSLNFNHQFLSQMLKQLVSSFAFCGRKM